MDDSDASSILSDPPPSDEEPLVVAEPQRKIKLNVSKPKKPSLKQSTLSFGSHRKTPSESPEPDPSTLGREPSPPHEYVMADNPDIAVIVMFQSRFNDAFLRGVRNLGPQDIEAGVVADPPSEAVEDLLCGLLGLVLNRKKNPEFVIPYNKRQMFSPRLTPPNRRGHFGRALEEALASQKPQWPPHWNGINPVPSSKTFASLSPQRRIDLLKTLVHWSLTASEAVSNMIRDHYKGTRKDYDSVLDCPPWGQDSLKRKFYLVEGQVDTPTRVYREGDRKAGAPTWQAVAGDIAGVQRLARDLRGEQSVAARSLADRMTKHVAVLEAREEKRKRREYRQNRKHHWSRPEPGFSLYEGRTRGNRPKYTFDDDEIYGTDTSTRRSARQSGINTPIDGPRYTASGRQVRSVFGASYAEPDRNRDGASLTPDDPISSHRRDSRPSRSSRATAQRGGSYDEGYESVDNADGADPSSEEEWNGDDEEGNEIRSDDDEHESDAASDDSLDHGPRSLIVKLRYGPRLSSLHADLSQGNKHEAMDMDTEPPPGVKNESNISTLPLSPPKPTLPAPPPRESGQPLSFSQYMYNNSTPPAPENETVRAPERDTVPLLPTHASSTTAASAVSQPNGANSALRQSAYLNVAEHDQAQSLPKQETQPNPFPQSQTASS